MTRMSQTLEALMDLLTTVVVLAILVVLAWFHVTTQQKDRRPKYQPDQLYEHSHNWEHRTHRYRRYW